MKRMSAGRKYALYTIAIVIMISAFAVIYFLSASKITTNVNEMVANAEKLAQEGDYDTAYYQLQLYCQENSDDSEAWILIADLCKEKGDTDLAYSYYQKAAKLTGCSGTQLGESDKVKTFDNFSSIESIKIYPSAKSTQDMTLSVSGENLTPQQSFAGKPDNNGAELDGDENYLTTDWFTVDDSKKSVYITGNINYAQWQFMDADGYYTSYIDDGDFKNSESVAFSSRPYSYAEIPQNSVKARVTYYNKSVETNVKSDDKIVIGYGNTLTGYTYSKSQNFDIPDLKENQYIEYKDDKWTFFDGNETTDLDWEKLSSANVVTISINGTLCGTVDVKVKEKTTKEADKNLQYGLKYSTSSGVASCERLGAAKGMSFDYKIGDEWNFGTGNDFDKAYPWCEMKLCNVKVNSDGSEKVTLEGDKNFKTDGSNGNVMVQIPKFYTMRVVQNGNEYIWISGTPHNGYSIEPIFVNSDGSIADYVYVSAYLGAEKDKKIVSVADSYPTICLNYSTTLEYAENNGEGFSEMNYLLYAALQKLFVVETGTIDSSSIFAGDSYMYYHYDVKDYENSGYAAESAKSTNTIRLYYNYNTMKICKGSSIAIFNGWKNYKNNNGTQREVVSVEVNGDYMDVTFDGEPMKIEKHKSNISNIPAKAGKTSTLDYCTGTLEGEEGKVSFKYRNIENLYGSALVMLDDDAYVQDGYFYYYSGDGILNQLSTPVAQQTKVLSDYSLANVDMSIKQMTYDKDNPQIMVPSVVGKGASSYTYYGDVWMYTNKNDGSKSYLFGGSADDNERVGGIFQLRAVINSYDSSSSFGSARIMYKSSK